MNLEAKADLAKLRLKEMEKVKNKEAETHKAVESKKASIEAKRELRKLKVEDRAKMHRCTNTVPKKCFGICND
ncbi:remorin-like [Cucumis melo var. makuwa]|uniref:Remorin-like n=1 Tax=Cucumis melo var. makuwa TaxID=1194695 RepID=A0A5D3DHT0_CUCMM|nr:remorin-like [Cucumis melo var. makuwa]TYK22940.1 remorin-like [Cucumis melo var. makuwa]